MKRAVIIGSGIAGLAGAKVISPYFDKVTIYDAGVPSQTNQLHVLLKQGQIILEEIFPGMRKRFLEHNCHEIDWAQDTLWENHSGVFPRYRSNITTLSFGRALLQDLMRSYVSQLVNVEFVSRRVEFLTEIEAELVLICGGEHFPLKRFLGEVVETNELTKIDLTYHSCRFKQSDLEMRDFKQYYFQVDPPYSSVGGVISPIEGGEVIATLIEKEESFSACRNVEDFYQKAKKVEGGIFYDIIKNAQPTTSLSSYRKTRSHRKKLAIKNIPENVLILGDVMTSFNPVFGQGMTCALMQAQILKHMLRENKFDARRFHLETHKLGRLPYFLSRTGFAEGGPLKFLLRAYLKLAQKIKPLHLYFLRQLHFLRQGASL